MQTVKFWNPGDKGLNMEMLTLSQCGETKIEIVNARMTYFIISDVTVAISRYLWLRTVERAAGRFLFSRTSRIYLYIHVRFISLIAYRRLISLN